MGLFRRAQAPTSSEGPIHVRICDIVEGDEEPVIIAVGPEGRRRSIRAAPSEVWGFIAAWRVLGEPDVLLFEAHGRYSLGLPSGGRTVG